MDPGDDMLTVDDVAARTRVSRSAVLDAIARGDLRAKKFGNRLGYRVRQADYTAWIATPTEPKHQRKVRQER